MSAQAELHPIKPKRDPFRHVRPAVKGATLLLHGFLLASQSDLQRYPPQAPETTYKRTLKLGQFWIVKPPRPRGRDIVGAIGNKRPYAVWVQGPTTGTGKKQVKRMKQIGWPDLTTVGKRQWRVYKPMIIRVFKKAR